MADTFDPAKRSQIMAAVRSRGNKATELKLLEILRKNGVSGWRRNCRLPGKPDFVFPKSKLAVFVDGCFWHGCRKHLRMPTTNREYWMTKIRRNQRRDHATVRSLRSAGWSVVRIWEHELASTDRITRRLTRVLGLSPNDRKTDGTVESTK